MPTMRRKSALAVASGGAALLLAACLIVTARLRPAPAALGDVAGFTQAARDARSWAAQAFAHPPSPRSAVSEPGVATAASATATAHSARQEALAAAATPASAATPAAPALASAALAQHLAPTREPAVTVRAPAAHRPPSSSFFRDAVSTLGEAPSTAALKHAAAAHALSFDSAAKTSLAQRGGRDWGSRPHTGRLTSRQQLTDAMTVALT